MSVSNSEELAVRSAPPIEVQKIVPLLLGLAFMTVGLAMFLSGTTDGAALVQPCIVVFGGCTVALLATFGPAHIARALQVAVDRGLRGGTSTDEIIRALMKVCDISRRDGLLGVAEVRSDSGLINNVCELIGDAAEEPGIHHSQTSSRESESGFHKTHSDVFLFTAIYAVMIGVIGTVLRAVSTFSDTSWQALNTVQGALRSVDSQSVAGSSVTSAEGAFSGAQAYSSFVENAISSVMLPAICGISLALLLTILIGRLRNVHQRELAAIDLAYQGAAIILEDNNVQRLKNRLLCLVPNGIR